MEWEQLQQQFKADILAFWSSAKIDLQGGLNHMASIIADRMAQAAQAGRPDLIEEMEQIGAIAEQYGVNMTKDTINLVLGWAATVVKYAVMAIPA